MTPIKSLAPGALACLVALSPVDPLAATGSKIPASRFRGSRRRARTMPSWRRNGDNTLKLSVTTRRGLALLGGLALFATAYGAGTHSGGHGGHDDDHTLQHQHADMAHHAHDEWVEPPPAYAGLISHRWADLDAIANGRRIYEQQCMACHGRDGQGAGPIAKRLAHPPADLTNNFHDEPGDGDAYLFWRVSEGGLVEPFRSQNSAMPAFKHVLTESERWDVLAFVHTFFHQGLAEWRRPGPAEDGRAGQSTTDGS